MDDAHEFAGQEPAEPSPFFRLRVTSRCLPFTWSFHRVRRTLAEAGPRRLPCAFPALLAIESEGRLLGSACRQRVLRRALPAGRGRSQRGVASASCCLTLDKLALQVGGRPPGS